MDVNSLKQDPRSWWIFKGESNFCQSLEYDVDKDAEVRCRPDGFYDIVSAADTVEGGIHVVEYSAYDALKKQCVVLKRQLAMAIEQRNELFTNYLTRDVAPPCLMAWDAELESLGESKLPSEGTT